MNFLVRLALLLPFLTAPSMAQGQLIAEGTQGASRICAYRGARVGTQAQQRSRQYRVGRGEPCPRTPPEPQAEPQRIPGMAILRAHHVQGGRRSCIYTDHVRDYVRAIPATSRCPMTPHF